MLRPFLEHAAEVTAMTGRPRGRRARPVLGFASVVDELSSAIEADGALPGSGARINFPSREAVLGIVADLRAAVFPRHFAADESKSVRDLVRTRIDRATGGLREQVRRALQATCRHADSRQICGSCDARAHAVTQSMIESLPRLRTILELDVQAAYDGDPAAASRDETLLCYPGVAAIVQHRIAHELYLAEVPFIPRIISEVSHSATGIDIHPGAEIGSSFFIDHGTGVVIGQTCSIGQRVRLYQGVTLGARRAPARAEGSAPTGTPRHPVVGDDVVIYAGATILGRITIGRGAVIGGNVWLTRSIEPGARVTQAQVRQEMFDGGLGI